MTQTSKKSEKQYIFRRTEGDTDTDTGTDTDTDTDEGEVLGVHRDRPSGGRVLGANRGRHVATGDETNMMASAMMAGASGGGLGLIGLVKKLRNRRNRRK